MSRKKSIVLISAILLLIVAGIIVWTIQSNSNSPNTNGEQHTLSENTFDAKTETGSNDGNQIIEQNSDNIAKQSTGTEAQAQDDFLRAATNFNGTGQISLNMTKKQLLSLLEEREVSYTNSPVDKITVSGSDYTISYLFSNGKLSYVLPSGSDNAGIQGLRLGDTVADMKKQLGNDFTVNHEGNGGPSYYYYKTSKDVLFIVTTSGEKQNSEIIGIQLVVASVYYE